MGQGWAWTNVVTFSSGVTTNWLAAAIFTLHVEALHQYLHMRANGFSQYIPVSHQKLVDKKQKSGRVDNRTAVVYPKS